MKEWTAAIVTIGNDANSHDDLITKNELHL